MLGVAEVVEMDANERFRVELKIELNASRLVVVERDTRARLWLLRTPSGGHLALVLKGRAVRYWGLGTAIVERVLAQCVEQVGLAAAFVFCGGEEGYVLSGHDVTGHRSSWSTNREGTEYKLDDHYLSGFADFRSARDCVALVAAIAEGLPPTGKDLGIDIFARPVLRRSHWRPV